MIGEGKTKTAQAPLDSKGTEENTLYLADWRNLEEDIAVLAAGYYNIRMPIREILGDDVANQ